MVIISHHFAQAESFNPRDCKAMKKTAPSPALSATEIILESISDGVFTVDHQWRITAFNRAAEAITGIGRTEAIGRRCSEVFRASMCEADRALRRTMETAQPIVNRAAYIIDSQGRRIPISVSTALLRDGRGRTVGGEETFRDLSLYATVARIHSSTLSISHY